MTYYRTYYESYIGRLTLVSDGKSLAGLWMEGQKYFESTLAGESAKAILAGSLDKCLVLQAASNWLDRYFAGEKPLPQELPLAPMGSEFRCIVWKLLCQIPYGEVITYGELAGKAAAVMGRTSMSAQAVGGAVGHNPISIIIPCHRVIGADGSLTGYAGGLERKLRLLEWEGVKNIKEKENNGVV